MSTFGSGLWGGAPGPGGGAPSGSPVGTSILYPALRLAGVTMEPQNIPSTEQYLDALLGFNLLVSSWNTLRNNIFAIEIDPWTLTPNYQQYYFGPGATANPALSIGAFNGPRPQRIERARLLLQTTPTTVYKELNLLSSDQWADKPVLDVVTIPNDLYWDKAFPISSAYFYPIPDQAYPIELFCWTVLQTATDVNALLSYPNGYDLALINNLALWLAQIFKKPITPDMRLGAATSLAAIQSFNAPVPRLKTELGILPGRGGYYSYLSGRVEP